MKIVLFHPVRLPPKDYGGVERVVLWLARGLVERGHEVHVGAFQGSELPAGAKLIPVEPGDSSALSFAKRIPPGTDVVHFQAPPEEGSWGLLPCAGLLTVHGNGKPGEVFPRNTVFLSADHARRHSARAFVYNGIDPSEYIFDPRSERGSYLFLSKTSWRVKNVAGAIELCKRAHAPLIISGGNRPYLQRGKAWLSSKIGGPQMVWAGPVSGAKKAKLLASARALVFPVLWPEPFGLVMVEAMMSGTPVLASPVGSVPEIVTSEVGATPHSEDEWLSLLSLENLPWKPEACRAWAMERFHYLKMAESYEAVYKRVMAGENLQEGTPMAPQIQGRTQ